MITPIRVEGSSRERGRQHGAEARRQIRSNLEIYRNWFESFGGLPWTRVVEETQRFIAVFDKEIPALAEEMRGIAEGAGVTIGDIVALNARTEIAYGVSSVMSPTECTSVGITPEASDDGHVYVAENWDWIAETLPNTLLLHIVQPDGFQILTFTEAGMLAKFGVNSAGIGLCDNLLASNVNRVGQTFHTLARGVLEARHLVGAMKAVTSASRAGSGNFMIASSGGEVIDMEWAPTDFHVFYAMDGYLTHTNHFVAELPGVRDRLKILKSASPGTLLRQARAHKFLRDHCGEVNAAVLQELLRDHTGKPEAICRHTDSTGLEVFGQSNASAIFDLTAKELLYTEGPPCESEYKRMRFPWA